MGVSHEKSKWNAAATAPRFLQILYRSPRFALLAGLLLVATFASAQQDLPQIISGERKPAHPKDTGPRALALLRLGANGKSSLVPITIRINGKFWDASVYKADPIPMAIEPGTVYEVERTGASLGLFTVGNALHSEADNAPIPWIATGNWVPAGTEPHKTELKAEDTPRGIEGDDAPPRLTRANEAGSTPAKPAPASSQPSAPSSTPSAQPAPTSPTAPASTAPPSSTPPVDKPAGTKPTEAKAAPAEPPPPPSDSGADESDRPRLRYGKPAQSFADTDVDIPGYHKPGATPASSKAKSNAKDDLGPVQLIPAISDAAGPQPSSYKFEWYKDVEDATRKQITDMANDQLRSYLATLARNRISAKPATSHGRAPAKPTEPILENEQMTSFDLWGSNIPVIVFSAEAHPALPRGAAAGTESDVKYSILVVAYPDIYSNLHKLYGAVTDKYHLDVTPRLELIDAVDVDGDGRGELLFRETSDAGTGWIIYRATADKLWKLFDSLNPE